MCIAQINLSSQRYRYPVAAHNGIKCSLKKNIYYSICISILVSQLLLLWLTFLNISVVICFFKKVSIEKDVKFFKISFTPFFRDNEIMCKSSWAEKLLRQNLRSKKISFWRSIHKHNSLHFGLHMKFTKLWLIAFLSNSVAAHLRAALN